MHTHVSENVSEIQWVQSLFPDRAGYLDVYDHYGLLGRRSVLAHGVHLTARERRGCQETGSAIAHCPTSNLFLGSAGCSTSMTRRTPSTRCTSGSAPMSGAGTSFSLLATMNEAYKVAELNTYPMNSIKSFYLATLGGANALDLGDKIGSLAVGKEADFVVLDPKATPLLELPGGPRGVDRGADVRAVDHGRRPIGRGHLHRRAMPRTTRRRLMSSGHEGYAHATTSMFGQPSKEPAHSKVGGSEAWTDLDPRDRLRGLAVRHPDRLRDRVSGHPEGCQPHDRAGVSSLPRSTRGRSRSASSSPDHCSTATAPGR